MPRKDPPDASDDAGLRLLSSPVTRPSYTGEEDEPVETEDTPHTRPESPFPTIDWLKDARAERARKRRRELEERRARANRSERTWNDRLLELFNKTRTWISVLLAGLLTGLVAAFLAIATAFLVDLKSGLCTAPVSGNGHMGWYLGKRVCCLGGAGEAEDGNCADWRDWSELLHGMPGRTFTNYAIFVLFSTLMGFFAAYLVVYLAPSAGGEGIPELKTLLGGNRIPSFLSPRTLLVKTAGLPLAIGSGLSIGKEGALLHVSACLARFSADVLGIHSETARRELLSAAAAAGIAVAFGAPIGGVLFSLEQVSSYFPNKTIWRSLTCAMISAVTLQLIDPYRGKRVVFAVPPGEGGWKMFEVWGFAVLGIVGGIWGGWFGRMNLRVIQWKALYDAEPEVAPLNQMNGQSTDGSQSQRNGQPHRINDQPSRVKIPLLARPLLSSLLLSLLTALMFYPSPLLRLDDLRVLELLFRDCPVPTPPNDALCPTGPVARLKLGVSLILAMTLKTCFTTVTYSLPIPSSVLIPSMVVGATFGRAFGMTVQSFAPRLFSICSETPDVPCVGVGRYALLGAIGALGGLTRLTASLTVIMFEVTGQLDLVVPSMVTLASARLVAGLFSDRGWPDEVIRVKGFPYLPSERTGGLGVDVSHCMTPVSRLVTVDERGMSWASLRKVIRGGFHGVPIVRDGMLVGYVAAGEIERMVGDPNEETFVSFEADPDLEPADSDARRTINLRYLVDVSPLTLAPGVSADIAADLFRKLGPRCILVTRRGRLEGLLTKKDLLREMEAQEAYGQEEENDLNGFSDASDDEDAIVAATVDSSLPLLDRAAITLRSWAREVGEAVRREMEEDELPLASPVRNRSRRARSGGV